MRHIPALPLLLILASAQAMADDAELKEQLAARLTGIEAHELTATPVPGLYEIMRGPNILYVSVDGRYLVRGQIVDLATHENLTATRRTAARMRWSAGLDEDTMVIFEPRGEVKHTITVFTDIDCGYCRQMHADINQLLVRGVRVRYLLYPRSGPGTPSAAKADAVWCSANRQDALTRAKAGRNVTAAPCGTTPVNLHLQWGADFGVTGTPSIVTDGGELIPGYLPSERLVEELERLRTEATAQRSR